MAGSATVGILRVLLTMSTAEFEAGAKRAADAMGVWQKNVSQIGRQAQQVGAALTKTITIPIVAAFAGSAKAAIDFESVFANVAKTVDGVSDKAGNLTTEGKALAQTFRNMAKEIPKTTEELTSIAALGGQMGVPIKQLEFFTKNVAALGVAVDGISTEDAAAGLAQIGNITGQGTQNIDKMASALVHLGNSSNATEADILEFTKRLAGAGHAVGMTVPEIMALGTAMANVGINAEAGGTAMSTVISKISKAVSTGSESLTEFARVANMSADQFAAVWKTSPVEALNAFVAGLSSMRDRGVDLNLTMGELGTEGIRVADTLKRLAGAGDGIAKSLVIANEGFATGNKHLEEAEKKYATTANQLKLLWNQVKDVGITFGNAFLPAIKSTTQTLGGMLPVIDTLAKGFAMLPGPVQMAAGGMGLALAATGPLIYGFGTLARASGDLAGAFAKKGIATQALTKAFNVFGGSASTMLTWLTRIGTAARASGLLFAGLSAAVIGIAVPVALAVITEHLRVINEELDQMIEASKLLGKPVMNADEARRILAAREAGAAGQPLKAKLFEPLTVDETTVWTKAKGAAEAYEGQVIQVKLAQADANAQFASTRNLTIEQVQAIANLSGAAQKYAGGVLQIGAAQKSATDSSSGLSAKLDELAKQIKDADAQIAKLDASTRDKLTKAIQSGAFSMKDLAKETGLSEFVLTRFEDRLKSASKATKEHEKETTAAEKAAAKHAAAIEKQADALEKLGIVTENKVVKELAELNELIEAAVAAGVPFDKVLLAVGPRLQELAEKAKASGVSLEVFGTSLTRAADAAGKARLAFAQLPPVVTGISQLPGTVSTLNQVMNAAEIQAQNTADSFKFFGLHTRAELMRTAQDAVTHFNELKRSGVATPEAIADAFEKMQAALKAAGLKVKSIGEEFRLIIKGLGHSLVADLAEGIQSGDWSQFAENLKQTFAKFIGLSLAAGVDFLVPGMGKFLEPLFTAIGGKLIGGIAKLFGRGDDGDKERDKLLNDMGGFTAAAQKLHDTLGAAGDRLFRNLQNANSGKEAAAAIDAITAALGRAEKTNTEFNTALGLSLQKIKALGGGIPDALRPLLDGLREGKKLTQENLDLLNDLASDGGADWKSIQEAVQRYGGDISKLGGSFQEQRLHESWQQIIDDIDLFQRGNISANDILDLTDDKINELVQQSKKFGTEVPENMRPWIQQLIDAGKLVDENGDKITDIGDLKFGETLQTSLQILTQTIKDLIAEFQKVPGAVAGVPKDISTTVTVRRRTIFESEGSDPEASTTTARAWTGGMVTERGVVPTKYFGIGGAVPAAAFTPSGTDTVPAIISSGQPAMLTPGEIILNEAHQGRIGETLRAASQFLSARALSIVRPPTDAMHTASASLGGPASMTVNIYGDVDSEDRARRLVRDFAVEVRRGGESRTLALRSLGLPEWSPA